MYAKAPLAAARICVLLSSFLSDLMFEGNLSQVCLARDPDIKRALVFITLENHLRHVCTSFKD